VRQRVGFRRDIRHHGGSTGQLVGSVKSGIECFCEYGDMLFFFDEDDADELVPQLEAPSGSRTFWTFASANTDVALSHVVTDTAIGAAKTCQVGPNERVLVDDFAAFEIVP
jgi:hypothetical protein